MSGKRTVAVVGASSNRAKFGNKALRAHVADGWEVYPINPNEDEVEGLKTVASVRDVPVQLDRVTMYVPPAVGLTLLDEIAAVQPGELWLNPGAESPELIQRARALGLEPIQACSILDVGGRPHE